MALLSATALQGYRNYTKRKVSYARYKVGSTWYTTKIRSVEVLSNGIVEISFMIELVSGSGTVSEVQVYDTDNQLWLSKTESLKMSDVSEGFYYVVRLDIKEVSS